MLVGSLILAGGRSRRMGKPKESLPFHGTTLLGRTVDTLLDCTWPVVVVARGGDQELPPLALEAHVVADDRPGGGPLFAIATGLRALRTGGELGPRDGVFVTGCDSPFLSGADVHWLAAQLGDHAVVMPRVGEHLQPLCAIYRLEVLATVEALLASGVDTPRTLAEKADTRVLDEAALRAHDAELRFLRNLNTQADYEQALAGTKP